LHSAKSQELTDSFGDNSTAVKRIDDPVVEFESVHGLQNRAHTANVVIDMSVINEFSGQVLVEPPLNL
jgi:hypothetical protein